jgi:hypothetical protein
MTCGFTDRVFSKQGKSTTTSQANDGNLVTGFKQKRDGQNI